MIFKILLLGLAVTVGCKPRPASGLRQAPSNVQGLDAILDEIDTDVTMYSLEIGVDAGPPTSSVALALADNDSEADKEKAKVVALERITQMLLEMELLQSGSKSEKSKSELTRLTAEFKKLEDKLKETTLDARKAERLSRVSGRAQVIFDKVAAEVKAQVKVEPKYEPPKEPDDGIVDRKFNVARYNQKAAVYQERVREMFQVSNAEGSAPRYSSEISDLYSALREMQKHTKATKEFFASRDEVRATEKALGEKIRQYSNSLRFTTSHTGVVTASLSLTNLELEFMLNR